MLLNICFSLYIISGSHGGHMGESSKRNISADLQLAAQYAAQVTHRDDGHQASSNHSPDYRQATSNGNSVSNKNNFKLLIFIY